LYRLPGGRRGRRALAAAAALALALPGAGCKSLSEAVSGFNAYPVEQDAQLGAQAYDEMLKGKRVVTSGPQHAMVTRVTERLVDAVMERDPEIAQHFEWEVVLIDENVVNAWCLPGGKMAVYTGILPVAQGEEGLAVVMGHEIAHATRRHGTRALTRANLMGAAAQIAGGEANVDPQILASVSQVLVGLPLGREAEREADATGILYTAAAGYDPRAAVPFWERMAAGKGESSKLEEFLSTHPPDQELIDNLRKLMPKAVAVYEQARAGGPPPKP
jgi:predicted Zn-dependent protease